MPRPSRFLVTLYRNRTYGTGSLTRQPRTIIGFRDKGRTILYVAGPIPVAGNPRAGFKIPGKQYQCSRSLFVSWLREVEAEMAEHKNKDT